MTCTDFVWFVNLIFWLWAGKGWIPTHDIASLLTFILGWFAHWGPLC